MKWFCACHNKEIKKFEHIGYLNKCYCPVTNRHCNIQEQKRR